MTISAKELKKNLEEIFELGRKCGSLQSYYAPSIYVEQKAIDLINKVMQEFE